MSELQLRFDEGHQQRYFSNRRELLKCIVRVGAQSPEPLFEVWGEGEPVRMADGSTVGKRFELIETIDLSQQEDKDRVLSELEALEHGGGLR